MQERKWDERFATLVRMADPGTINALPIPDVDSQSIRGRRSTSRFLANAIHSMTPYRGIGANVALKDAMRLAGR